MARAGDTVDGRALGERILAGDIDLQFLLCGETRLELIEVRAAGFGMPQLKDGETAVFGHLGYEVDDLEDTKVELTRRRGRLAGRRRDRRGPLDLHGAADDVRGDPAPYGAQGPRDGRVSAEGLRPAGAGADVDLTACGFPRTGVRVSVVDHDDRDLAPRMDPRTAALRQRRRDRPRRRRMADGRMRRTNMANSSRNERIISRVRAIPKRFVGTCGDVDPQAPRLVGRTFLADARPSLAPRRPRRRHPSARRGTAQAPCRRRRSDARRAPCHRCPGAHFMTTFLDTQASEYVGRFLRV